MKKVPAGRIRRVIAIFFLLSIATPEKVRAELSKNAEYQAALAALSDSLPEVAAQKLSRLLALPDSGDRREVRIRLAEALVRADRPVQALDAASHESISADPRARFWRGMALTSSNELAAAAKEFEPLASDPSFPQWKEAVLTRAEIFQTLGDSDAALAELGKLAAESPGRSPDARRARLRAAEIELGRENYDAATQWIDSIAVYTDGESADPEITFFRAHLALRRNRPKDAVDLFHQLTLLKSDEVSPAFCDAAFLGESDAHLQKGDSAKAIKSLKALIATRPHSPYLGPAFQRLESHAFLTREDVAERMTTWANAAAKSARQTLASYFLGVSLRQANRPAEAIEHFNTFAERFPDHVLATAALLESAELLVQTGQHHLVADTIGRIRQQSNHPAVRQYVEELEARDRFKRGEFPSALGLFRDSAVKYGGSPAVDFNTAVAALYAGDTAVFERVSARIKQASDTENAAELMLEKGLFYAAQSDSRAFGSLEEFLRLHENHPRSADARLALAELFLNQVPPLGVPAREQLEAARKGPPLTATQRERLDYVTIWVEVGEGQHEATIAAASRFLEEWKKSERRPTAFMILGEAYYHLQDYANAMTYFERLAEEAPESDLAGPARFFAAKSASLTLQPANQQFAIETWARVAEAGGPLAAAARHEQGLLKLTLDQIDDAIAAFDSILAMEKIDPELRVAARCEKGQALFAKAAAAESDPVVLQKAMDAFLEVENDPAASRSWKYQSAVRRGRCLEALDREEEALEVFYGVVRSGGPLGPVASVPVAEFDWFYRAGLAAVKLLEKRENWKAAVRIAERLAQAGGPRAAEAANLADRLRLRHFIWDEAEE